jgi:hypothetical protein
MAKISNEEFIFSTLEDPFSSLLYIIRLTNTLRHAQRDAAVQSSFMNQSILKITSRLFKRQEYLSREN